MICKFFKDGEFCGGETLAGDENGYCLTHSRKPHYTVQEAAKIWHVSDRAVIHWIDKTKQVKASKVRGQWQIPSVEFKWPHPSERPRAEKDKTELPPGGSRPHQPNSPGLWRRIANAILAARERYMVLMIVLGVVIIGVLVVLLFVSRGPVLPDCPIDPAYFSTQDGDGDGIHDEFFVDFRYTPVTCLQVVDGADLRRYDWKVTFQGGDGRKVQLFYKNFEWKNVYSRRYIIVYDQPIRYSPFKDGRDVSEFDDFSHIYAVGAKIIEGVEGVQIRSAKLIPR